MLDHFPYEASWVGPIDVLDVEVVELAIEVVDEEMELLEELELEELEELDVVELDELDELLVELLEDVLLDWLLVVELLEGVDDELLGKVELDVALLDVELANGPLLHVSCIG
jgi:hypothetical protein